MRITKSQLYAAFDVTDPGTTFVDIIEKDEDNIIFYKDGNKEEAFEIRFDGIFNRFKYIEIKE